MINKNVLPPTHKSKLLLLLAYFAMQLLWAKPGQDPTKEHFTTLDGLANNMVTDMAQDSIGFIWIATQDGLSRFDGERFVNYRQTMDKAHALPSNNIKALFVASQGHIWIGTDKGLAVLSAKTDTLREVRAFSGKVIVDIFEDKLGSMWVTTAKNATSEIYFKAIESTHWQRYRVKPHDKFRNSYGIYIGEYQIEEDTVMVLAAFTADSTYQNFTESLYFWNEQREEWDFQLITPHRTSYIDSTATLFLTPSVGRSPNTPYYDIAPSTEIQHVHFEPSASGHIDYLISPFSGLRYKGNIYLIQSTGIDIIQTNKEYLHLGKEYFPDAKSYTLKGMLIDRAGNLWVYNSGSGIYLFNNGGLSTIQTYSANSENPQNTLSGNSIRAIYQHSNGNLWVSSYNEKRLQDTFWADGTKTAAPVVAGISMVARLNRFDSTSLYFGGVSQISEIDAYSGEVRNNYAFFQGEINGMVQLVDSSWIFTTAQGLFKLLPRKQADKERYADRSFAFWNKNRHDSSYVVQQDSLSYSYAYQDREEKIWLCLRNKGLGIWDRELQQSSVLASNQPQDSTSLPSNHIKCIYQDTRRRFWVATTNGFARFYPNENRFKRYTTQDGLPNMMVYGILEDDQGELWLSTNKGISNFDPEQETFENFDMYDGLQDNEFNTLSFFKNEETGELFFGGLKGMNRFFPKDFSTDKYVPPIVLTAYKKLGQAVDLPTPISKAQKIELPLQDAQMLTFEFAALSYYQAEQNQYAYRVEGLNDTWVELESKNEVTLTNLPAGSFVLHIKGSNHNGVWNEEGLKIKIKINPPFWQTPSFTVLLLVLFTGSGYGLYRYRLNQAKRREQKLQKEIQRQTFEIRDKNEELESLIKAKTKLFSIISHDLRSPLAAFETIAEQLDFYIQENEMEQVQALSKHIEKSAGQLSQMLDNLLKWSMSQQNLLVAQLQEVDVEAASKEILNIYQASILINRIHVECELEEGVKVFADHDMLLTILRNLVGNALKFTPEEGRITLRAHSQYHNTCIEIEDTGVGMSEEMRKQLSQPYRPVRSHGLRGEKGTGLGFILVRELSAQNHATIEVESNIQQGTLIRLLFPKNCNST